MTGTETTIVRWDGDNKPLAVNVVTGVVDRPNSYYPAPLKGETARALFLGLVGIAQSHEVPALIRACNRAAARKQPVTDEGRRQVALQYAGIVPTPVRSAARHHRNCDCRPCLRRHLYAGCRVVGCKVCFK